MLDAVQKFASHTLHRPKTSIDHEQRPFGGCGRCGMANRNEKGNQECWRFLTTGERVLLLLQILTITVLSILFIYVVFLLLRGQTCNSPHCVRASSRLLEMIDFEVDPCQNLHDFICGEEETNNLARMESRKKSIIAEFFENGNSDSLLVVKLFYQACTNDSAIEEDGNSTVLELVEQLGGWPLLLGQNWEEDFYWLKFMPKLRNLGLRSDWFIEFSWHEDENGTNLLKIDIPSWFKPIPNSMKQIYYQTMVDIAVAFNSSTAIAWKELLKVASFENNLVTIGERARNRCLANDDQIDITITVQELNQLWPEVDLVTVLNNLAKGYAVFTDSSVLVVGLQNYLYELSALLARTPRRTQADFLIWKTIESLLPHLAEEYRLKYERFSEIGSREEYCAKETTARFYKEIEAEYVRKYVDDHTREEMQRMVDLIKEEMTEEDSETNVVIGEFALNELSGGNDFEFRSDNIIDMIREAQYADDNLPFKCLNNMTKCNHKRYNRLGESEEIEFDYDSNTIYIPNGLLQSDWYDFNQPNYLNYGGLGRLIGDVIHNAVAEVNNASSPEPQEDLGVVDLVYLGYSRWVQRKGGEEKLPGLNYTTKQLFWIYSASLYCRSTNTSAEIERIGESEYFMNDFNCQ